MLEVRNLHKSYGSKIIIDKWSYHFETGKIYGLIGRNGIGKTTILKCICGLVIPDKAEIFTEKGELSKEDYLNRDIVYVSDEPIYYHNLTLQEHLWLVCKVENTKCPVSAAVMAVLIVSKSRISPTRITSGSSRRAALSAFA